MNQATRTGMKAFKQNLIILNNGLIKYLIILLFFASCQLCKYTYNSKGNSIVSKKNNAISTVEIVDSTDSVLAAYVAKDGVESKSFSLNNFSPEYFKCIQGEKFHFETGIIYFIRVSPTGDRMLTPIKLEFLADGKFKEVKLAHYAASVYK